MFEELAKLIITLNAALFGAALGLFAVVFSESLTREGEVFSWWPGFVSRISDNKALHKALYGCPKCTGGQMACWSGLIVFGDAYTVLFATIVAITVAWYVTEK